MTQNKMNEIAGIQVPVTKSLALAGLLNVEEIDQLILNLQKRRIEIKDGKKGELIVKVKQFILTFINDSDKYKRHTLSTYLSIETSRNYTYLSNLFYKREGVSINNYMIEERIRMTKALIRNDELTLSAIAEKVGYSSIHHLSNQFKQHEGISPIKWKREMNK